MAEKQSPLEELRSVVAALRSPEGCPWDREQTHESLKPYLLEEAHEVAEAISSGEPTRLAGELGDLLLHVFLHARLAEERGEFDVEDVAAGAVKKLTRRHPHVFGDAPAKTPQEVRQSWERIKREERGASGTLDVPPGLSALFRAKRVQERAAAVGFDWPDVQGVVDKIREELVEVERALGGDDRGELADELGDLLFAVVNLVRFVDVDPDEALHAAVRRFSHRFQRMEEELERMGTPIGTVTIERMDSVWDRLKADNADE